jgi:hypothetical protein
VAEAVIPRWLGRSRTGQRSLDTAARLWFIVAVVGQWAFVYYIVAFYAGPTLQGRFEAWNRKDLITGYVAGDRVGNLYFAAHVLMAALITTSGALQLFPQIRARAISFHRWNGRLYILTAFLMAAGGLWLVWVRGTYLTLYGAAGSTVLALLIMTCAAMTLRYALARKIDIHRQWALRTFLVANGVWFQRIGYMAWITLNRGPVGIGKHMDGLFDILWGFGDFFLPLAVLEIYMRVKDQGSALAKSVTATAVFVLTAVMSVGIIGAYMIMWRPLLATSRPVFNLQSSDARELALAVGDEYSADRDRVTGNHRVQTAHR